MWSAHCSAARSAIDLGAGVCCLFYSALAPILMLIFLYGPTWITVAALIGLGLTAISPQPVILALVQDEFPKHRALANGTYLALNFVVRAIGIWVVGMVADQFGMSNAFLLACLAAFLSLPAVVFLPKRKTAI